MEKTPIHLTVLRKGDSLIIDLDEVGALIPRSETQVESSFLQELTGTVMRLATLGYGRSVNAISSENLTSLQPSTVIHDLQQVGGLIFSHLLTEPARNRLRTAETVNLYLRLDEQLIQIPWELCFDGEQFLITKFPVGRQVITGAPIPQSVRTQAQNESLKILLLVDPTETLPEANKEAQLLCTLLDNIPQVEVSLLGGKQIQKIPLLAELQEYDLVHFAGHSFYDPHIPSKSGWRLYDSILTAGELSKCRHPPQVVFSNSCQAGATAEKAIALDPNDAEGCATLGEILTWVNKPDQAIEWTQKAIRLNPQASISYLWILGHAHRLAGQYEAAMAMQREVLRQSPTHIGAHVELAVNASELGHEGQARAEAAEIRRISPQISLESLRRSLPYKDQALLEHVLAQLSKAGLR